MRINAANRKLQGLKMHFPQSDRRGGSLPMVALGACATAVMPAVAIAKPEYAYPCIFFFLIGLTVTWRQYVRWRRTEHGHGG
ncbi:MAG: hypothetical protein NT151_10025 [Acidobacteria bacterium]|nr:hypothetical protein [Acidobacteriota bacterium]